jgi:SHS2 domain-containing protein
MSDDLHGFQEIEHTADWALKVWAPDYVQLFRQAALGMNTLAQLQLDTTPRVEERIKLSAMDIESLLVAFLSELVYFAEQDDLGFDSFEISLEGNSLQARLCGAPIASRKKEIKAVTYHNLEVEPTESGYTVVIVFDV